MKKKTRKRINRVMIGMIAIIFILSLFQFIIKL